MEPKRSRIRLNIWRRYRTKAAPRVRLPGDAELYVD